MKSFTTILKEQEKKHGEGLVTLGVSFYNADRIPTGIFPLDVATGGGFPKGRISVIYGPESSLKTTVALKAIATYQHMEPEKYAVFVDQENALDPDWATKMGVNVDNLGYSVPEFAEQCVDLVEQLIYAKDVGLIVLDSIAALTSAMELDQSAESHPVGRSGINAGKLYRRATTAMGKVRREGRFPTLVCINQTRFKIGVTHGDPETQPGGQAFKFASALTLRVYGKDLNEKKAHPALPWAKQVSGVIKKYKVPVIQRNFSFVMPNMTLPNYGVAAGVVDSSKTIMKYLKALGHMEKVKEGYRIFEDTYKTQKDFTATLKGDEDFRLEVQQLIISEMLEKQGETLPDTDSEDE